MTAEDQAAAFGVLSGVLDDVYGPPGAAGRPLLFGPDPHSFRDAGSALPVTIKYLATFVRATKAILSYVTHHEYIEITADNVLLPSFLDTSAEIGRAVVAGVRNVSATIRVAAGEIGPHNGGTYGPGGVTPNCAGNKVCGRFGSALWYADSMSAKGACAAPALLAAPFCTASPQAGPPAKRPFASPASPPTHPHPHTRARSRGGLLAVLPAGCHWR